MNDNASRFRDGGSSPRWLVAVLVGIAVSSLPVGELAAKPLSEEDCSALDTEMKILVSDGVERTLQKDPLWAKASLTPAELERIARFLTLEDELAFRCRGADRKLAQARAAKTKGRSRTSRAIPLPVRKPGDEKDAVVEFVAGPHSVHASASEHLGAIAPATPRRTIKLPLLSAAVAPLPGLRRGIEPAELDNVEAESKEKSVPGAATDLGSALASANTSADKQAPKTVEGLSVPLPERKPEPPASRQAEVKPRSEAVKRPTVRRARKKAPLPQDVAPSAASAFHTD